MRPSGIDQRGSRRPVRRPLERQSLQQAGSQSIDQVVVAHPDDGGGGPAPTVPPPPHFPGADLASTVLLHLLGRDPAPLKRLQQEREVGDLEVSGAAGDR